MINADPNQLFIPKGAGTTAGGRPIGFEEAYENAIDYQVYVNATYGFEKAYQEEEDINRQKARSVGVEVQPISDHSGTTRSIWGGLAQYTRFQEANAAAAAYIDREFARGTPLMERVPKSEMEEMDRLYTEAAAKNPALGIRTHKQMQEDAQARLFKIANPGEKEQWGAGAYAGTIAGGVRAAFKFTTNPIAVANVVPVWAGRTIATRMLAQAGYMMFTETAQQLPGIGGARTTQQNGRPRSVLSRHGLACRPCRRGRGRLAATRGGRCSGPEARVSSRPPSTTTRSAPGR